MKYLKSFGILALVVLFSYSSARAATILFPIGGGTGRGTLSAGQLVYGDGTSPVSTVATTTLTASSPLSLSNPVVKVGGSNSVLTIDTSGTWSGNAGTATALAANGTNCSAGNYPLGVDASGNAESCTLAGTVTSVGLSSTNSTLTIGSSPVTTSGTITADLNLAHSNTWTAVQKFNTSPISINASTTSLFANSTTTLAQVKNNLLISTSTIPRNGFSSLDIVGNQNNLVGVELGVANYNAGALANSFFYFNNDLTDSTLTHYAGFQYNSSGFTDTESGALFAKKNGLLAVNTDGSIGLLASTTNSESSTNAFIHFGTNNVERMRITSTGKIGEATNTPLLGTDTIYGASSPQLTLTNGAGIRGWAFRNAGGNFYLSTTTTAGTATTTPPAFTINGANGRLGVGTSTPGTLLSISGTGSTFINLNASATSTLSKGINLKGGCFAVSGTCVTSGGAGMAIGGAITSATAGSVLFANATLAQNNSNFFWNNSRTTLGIGTTTPRYSLTVASSTAAQLDLTSGVAGKLSWVFRTEPNGNLAVATTTVAGTASTTPDALLVKPNQPASLVVGSSTPSLSAVNGLAVFGTNTKGGTTTISTGRIQFDGYNSAGTRSCAYIVGTSWVIKNSKCIP